MLKTQTPANGPHGRLRSKASHSTGHKILRDHGSLARSLNSYIGLSYCDYWDGRLDVLRTDLDDLAAEFGKPVVVAETAYP
jgi:arabinogalactan endo-1,4-beta-galactosidase